jgi:hypothetical protein
VLDIVLFLFSVNIYRQLYYSNGVIGRTGIVSLLFPYINHDTEWACDCQVVIWASGELVTCFFMDVICGF